MTKRLSKIGIWFKGPHSAELFKYLYVEESYRDFDHVRVGSGESMAVAATRAIAHFRDLELPHSVMEDIRTHVQIQLPAHADKTEGDQFASMYCIVAISLE